MAETTDEPKQGCPEGTGISREDLHSRFGIPPAEAASFQDIARVYVRGDIIIREGDPERALYLLRAGRAGVFKGSGDSLEPMGTVDAVNFFGEMSMINDKPRSATVIAQSETVVVYRIPNPNIHTILTNPLWAELLITRLAGNLARAVEQNATASEQLKELRAELTRLKRERGA